MHGADYDLRLLRKHHEFVPGAIFDTMLADTLHTMFARKLRGFEDCDAPKLYRHFVQGKGTISVAR